MLFFELQHKAIADYMQKHCEERSVGQMQKHARKHGEAMYIVPAVDGRYFLISSDGSCYASVERADYPDGWMCPGEQGPKDETQAWYNDRGMHTVQDIGRGWGSDSSECASGNDSGWMD